MANIIRFLGHVSIIFLEKIKSKFVNFDNLMK